MDTLGNVLRPELNRAGAQGGGCKCHTCIVQLLVQMDNQSRSDAEALRCTSNPELITFYHFFKTHSSLICLDVLTEFLGLHEPGPIH